MYEGSWSGMRKYLEQDMLAESLRGRVRYDCTAYPQVNFSSRMFAVWVDGEIVQRFCIEEACRWFVEKGRIPWEKHGEILDRWHAFWELLAQTPPSSRDAYTDDEFAQALAAYRNQAVQTSLRSDDPIVCMLALLDRRVGKRSLAAFAQTLDRQPAWLQGIYHLREESDQ